MLTLPEPENAARWLGKVPLRLGDKVEDTRGPATVVGARWRLIYVSQVGIQPLFTNCLLQEVLLKQEGDKPDGNWVSNLELKLLERIPTVVEPAVTLPPPTPKATPSPEVMSPQQFAHQGLPSGLCPDCGSTLFFLGGCYLCISCGHSKCE